MLPFLLKHCAFKVVRAKILASPTCSLCFPLQFSGNRDTLWLLTQCTQPMTQAGLEFAHNCFGMSIVGCCLVFVWSEPKSLKSERSSDFSEFLVRLLMACKQHCLLIAVRDWSFKRYCTFFLSNSAVTLKTEGCKCRHIFLFAAGIFAPLACWLR